MNITSTPRSSRRCSLTLLSETALILANHEKIASGGTTLLPSSPLKRPLCSTASPAPPLPYESLNTTPAPSTLNSPVISSTATPLLAPSPPIAPKPSCNLGVTAKNHKRHIAQHHYRDHASETVSPTLLTAKPKPKGGVTVPFPIKLHKMLDEIEKDGYANVVSWQPHGRAFVVHKPKEFVDTVLPEYFRQSKFSSFQRQLNLYGFSRLSAGRDKGGYYHELFLRGKPSLSGRMVRTKVKGTGVRGGSSPDTEPNFYSMPPVVPDDENNEEEMSDVVVVPGEHVVGATMTTDEEEDVAKQARYEERCGPLSMKPNLSSCEFDGMTNCHAPSSPPGGDAASRFRAQADPVTIEIGNRVQTLIPMSTATTANVPMMGGARVNEMQEVNYSPQTFVPMTPTYVASNEAAAARSIATNNTLEVADPAQTTATALPHPHPMTPTNVSNVNNAATRVAIETNPIIHATNRAPTRTLIPMSVTNNPAVTSEDEVGYTAQYHAAMNVPAANTTVNTNDVLFHTDNNQAQTTSMTMNVAMPNEPKEVHEEVPGTSTTGACADENDGNDDETMSHPPSNDDNNDDDRGGNNDDYKTVLEWLDLPFDIDDENKIPIDDTRLGFLLDIIVD